MLCLAALTYVFVPWFLNILWQMAGTWGFLIRVLSVLVTVFILLIWTHIVLNGLSKPKTKNAKHFWVLPRLVPPKHPYRGQ